MPPHIVENPLNLAKSIIPQYHKTKKNPIEEPLPSKHRHKTKQTKTVKMTKNSHFHNHKTSRYIELYTAQVDLTKPFFCVAFTNHKGKGGKENAF